MILTVKNECGDFNSYRAARVKSLFNAERGNKFELTADLPLEGDNWQIGLIVGPSGSGKTTIGRALFGGGKIVDLYSGWPDDAPIVDAISPGGDFDSVTGALANVGLGDVPAWLRPFKALSNGQQFRAGLADWRSCRPEHRPAKPKRWNCATATQPSITAKVYKRPSTMSRPFSHRH